MSFAGIPAIVVLGQAVIFGLIVLVIMIVWNKIRRPETSEEKRQRRFEDWERWDEEKKRILSRPHTPTLNQSTPKTRPSESKIKFSESHRDAHNIHSGENLSLGGHRKLRELRCSICGYSWTTRRAYTIEEVVSCLCELSFAPCGHSTWGGLYRIVEVDGSLRNKDLAD